MMWHTIQTDEDLENLNSSLLFFHDSCIKEMHYLSGAFVDEQLAMLPINEKRILRVVFQRQFRDDPVIELEFEGLKYLRLFPVDEKYTCEILGAALFRRKGCIYWCDDDVVAEDDLDHYSGTIICASCLRWRTVENGLGQQPIYQLK